MNFYQELQFEQEIMGEISIKSQDPTVTIKRLVRLTSTDRAIVISRDSFRVNPLPGWKMADRSPNYDPITCPKLPGSTFSLRFRK